MSEMTSGLVERIEAATGLDRELDAAIAAALRIGTEHDWARNYPKWEGRSDGRVHLEKHGPSFAAPTYTASIDAAMTLVPEGWSVDLSLPGPFDGMPYAKLMSLERNPYGLGESIKGKAPTPALAICAAALRARAPLPAPPAKDTI